MVWTEFVVVRCMCGELPVGPPVALTLGPWDWSAAAGPTVDPPVLAVACVVFVCVFCIFVFVVVLDVGAVGANDKFTNVQLLILLVVLLAFVVFAGVFCCGLILLGWVMPVPLSIELLEF